MSHPASLDGRAILEPTLPVAAVARRLGIAPATLRTWDRRYGIGPSGHTTGRHRRYAPADVARLELMQRALLRGATPAEAAEYALRVSPAPAVDGVLAPEPVVLDGAGPDPEAAGVRTVRAGGRVLRLPGKCPWARGLGRAALAMDATSAQQLLADLIAAKGAETAWTEVIRPVLAAVACRWEQSGEYVEVEHLVYECVLAAVIGATPLVTAPRNPRPVLLCCVPDERHSLPLYVLRAALAGRGIGTQMLGAALPADALASAVRRTAPLAVALWAHLPRYAWATVFDELPRTRQPIRLFACGPGWFATALPDRVEHLDDLPGAVDRIEALLGGRHE
ncbi:MAG TPA: MerR family transcriptional regulator [Actinophytocola sp.]|uniref:MerR family transcriptional regulator n=1 Tax=Actinophytocola sp. TaxID=1872138 RepID=UPI002DB8DDB7|nr:MerR family transcriptional regulator [Actinophytocola sp.]HEU5475980.1 MerR family transcriptional regulator [Actinophytocola sp.]